MEPDREQHDAQGGRIRPHSLRSRLAFTLCAVLLPFVLAASLGIVYLLPALLGPMEAIVAEVTEELEPVRHLQLSLITAALAARDGRGGPDAAEVRARIDEAFTSVQAAPGFDAEERTLIQSARREWEEALAAYSPASSEMSAEAQARVAATHAEYASSMLDGVYIPARHELQRDRRAAQAARTRTLWVTFSTFLLALGISVYAGTRFAGPLLDDVDSLRQAAMQLASGELSHRVRRPRTDELGDLAAAFNAMGERLQADQAALSELATRDALTGLLNRREFLRLLRDEIDRSRRYGRSFALLLLDIDHFKKINDTWGHPTGDEVLRSIAARVINELRPTDRPARYGGEEFGVLLPETTLAGAASLAERLRAAIASAPVVVAADQAVPVTASIGIADYPEGGLDEKALISITDRNLYAAKAGGRNRVMAGAALS